MEKFIVIMAGGVGTRFWPRSRKNLPKQLLNILGENTMIQDTVYRLDGFASPERIFIITNKVQKTLIEEQLPQIPAHNIIAEPVGRNTSACIALSAEVIHKINKDAVLITLPADHLIRQKEKFVQCLNAAADYADKSHGLVTFGINPTRPDTGYGYIKYDKNEAAKDIHKVISFVEKPDIATAKSYLQSGDFLWNSGMFVWRADSIIEEMNKYLPSIPEALAKLGYAWRSEDFTVLLNNIYPGLESISIDYGVMEKSDKVYLIRGNFDWSDVGSWETVYELTKKDENENAKSGEVFTRNTSGSYIYSADKFTAVIGAKNMVIIDTKDALLVCSRDDVQDVKEVVNYLNGKGRDDLV